MAKVRRANVVLKIKDEQVQRYLDSGYELINEETGEVVASPVPSDLATLRRYYVEHTDKIKMLEARIAELEKPSAEVKPAKRAKAKVEE